MISPFDEAGNLPAGIYWASWKEFEKRFGTNAHRKKLLAGLKQVAANLREAGCLFFTLMAVLSRAKNTQTILMVAGALAASSLS